jgi:ABC-2 type transport system ATP-binding protein
VAFVSEQPYFYQYLTARESLRFSWRLSGFSPAGMEAAIDRSLARVGLGDQGSKKVREFSKGMQQRLNMAQALLGEAGLYVFDEPMSGLDPLGRRLFRSLFRELAQEGKCVFFSTHILEDIATLCDHVVALAEGRLVYDGPITDLLSRGYTGTEIVVESLPEALGAELAAGGYSLTRLQTGATQILASNQEQSAACLKLLYRRELVPHSVTPRTQPIESILYGGQKTEVAS